MPGFKYDLWGNSCSVAMGLCACCKRALSNELVEQRFDPYEMSGSIKRSKARAIVS